MSVDLAHHGELPVGRAEQRTALDDSGELLFPQAHVRDLGVRSAPAVAAVVGDQPVAQRGVGGFLDSGIERRAYRETTFIEPLLAICRHQVAAHFLGEEIGRRRFGGAALAELQPLGPRLLRFGCCDVAVLLHAVQHIVATGVGFLLVAHEVVAVRRLGQRRKIGDLRQRELVERPVKIVERRLGHTVVARAKVNLVQVEFEDALFGIGLLDAEGQDRLADLARQSRLVGKQEVLGDLLGDARGAFRAFARIGDVGNHGTDDADEIDAGVGEEALILGRDEGLGHQLGHGGNRYEHALLASVLGKQSAIRRIQARHRQRLVVGQLLVVGQSVAEMPEQARHGAGSHDEDGGGEGQQDFEEVEHGHLLRGAFRGSNGENSRDLCLSCGGASGKMGIDRGSEGARQRKLVLANRQQLLVLGIGQIAELDQGRGDIRCRQHGKPRLSMGPRQ